MTASVRAPEHFAGPVACVQNAVAEEHEHVAGLGLEGEFVVLGIVKQAEGKAGGFNDFDFAIVAIQRPRQAGIRNLQRALRSSQTA